MKYCIHCGHEIMPNAVVCIHCGRAVPTQVKYELPQVETSQSKPTRKNNALCIAGFITSFFIGLVGLILCCVGLKQAQKNNEGCQGLAIAGIVISCFVTLIQALLILRALIIAVIGLIFLIFSTIFSCC